VRACTLTKPAKSSRLKWHASRIVCSSAPVMLLSFVMITFAGWLLYHHQAAQCPQCIVSTKSGRLAASAAFCGIV
jgi:hypothetical protein